MIITRSISKRVDIEREGGLSGGVFAKKVHFDVEGEIDAIAGKIYGEDLVQANVGWLELGAGSAIESSDSGSVSIVAETDYGSPTTEVIINHKEGYTESDRVTLNQRLEQSVGLAEFDVEAIGATLPHGSTRFWTD